MNVRGALDSLLSDKFFGSPKKSKEEVENKFSLPESKDTIQEYLESEKFEDFKKEAIECLEKLIEWVDEAWNEAEESDLKDSLVQTLNNFLDTHFLKRENIGKSHYALYVEGVPTIPKILNLLKINALTLEAKKNIISHFIQGLEVCSGGSHTHIMDAHEQLSADIPFQLRAIRKEIARKVVLDFINQDPELSQIPGNEIHYVNAVLNYLSQALMITKVNDFFCEGMEDNPILNPVFENFRGRIIEMLTLNNVINILYRNLDISNLILENGSMPSQKKLINKLNLYGYDMSFHLADLFNQDEDHGYTLKKEGELEFYIKLTLLNRLKREGYISLDHFEHYHTTLTINDIKIFLFSSNIRELSHVQYEEEGEQKKEPLTSFLAKQRKEKWFSELYYFCPHKHRADLLHLAQPFPCTLQKLTHEAVQNGDVDCIKKLAKIGIALDTRNTQGDTIAHIAAYFGHANFILALEKINKDLLRERNAKGRTPLHIAAAKGYLEIVQILILSGAPLDAQDNEGNTLLHLVSYFGHEKIAANLEKAGSNLNGKNLKGQTPLHIAVFRNNLQMVRLLIELGANLNEPDNQGRTPQDIAKLRGYVEVILELHGRDNQRKRRNSGSPSRLLAAPRVQNNRVSEEEKEEAEANTTSPSSTRVQHRK